MSVLMTSPLQLKDVFTPGGQPSITYVKREHLELEQKIGDALSRGFAFNVVTGPTKSGKSVLCRRVLSNEHVVVIEGGQIRTEADFWAHLAHRLDVAASIVSSAADTLAGTISGEGSAGIATVVQAKGTYSHTRSDQQTNAKTFNKVVLLDSMQKMISSGFCLLIDDFHYIDHDVQRNIIRSLKGPVFEGLPVFLLAVPHRAFDPMTVESEVEGRFKHIPIPSWATEDLIQIPSLGFDALGVVVDRPVQRHICDDSFGNPLLVQEICSEFCLANKVKGIRARPFRAKVELLEATYRNMAESKGFPTYIRLKAGPPGRRSRQLRKMAGGGQEDIYTALLAAVARDGPKQFTPFDDIRASLKRILASDAPSPQKAEIVSGLKALSLTARSQLQGEPPIEWLEDRNGLAIVDPFLMFYLKWSFRDQGGSSQ